MTNPIKPCPACGGEMEVNPRVQHVDLDDCNLGYEMDGTYDLNVWNSLCTQIESRAAARWVAVSDELPESNAVTPYYMVRSRFGVSAAIYFDELKHFADQSVTHWLKLNPQVIPKGGE